MLGLMRRFLNTWVARLFFLLLVASFGVWGIGDVVTKIGTDTAVAHVAGYRIELPQFQEAYQRQISQVQRMYGGKMEITPDMRRAVADQAIQQLIAQTAVTAEIHRLGLVVPDQALRNSVTSMPAFRGPNGQFNRANFDAVLQNNGLSEARFLEMMRADLAQRQLMAAVQAGAVAPDVLARQVFDFEQEKRVADLVDLPFSAAPEPPAPTDAQLTRYYDNHPDTFSTPEYRRIKAVILSPETVAKTLDIPEDELRAWYDQHKAELGAPEKRTAQVVVAQDEAAARKLAEEWKQTPDWAKMQETAKQQGATTAELTDATEAEFPTPELAKAAFAATADAVTGPVQTPLGWDVLRVTRISAGTAKSFDQAKEEVRNRVAQDRAADVIYQNATKVEDILASGAPLDQLPSDLGLGAVTGTLDRKGMTREGMPAPIPGSPGLRSALIAAAFRMQKGEQPQLTEVPASNGGVSSYYAVTVEDIMPPARKPFEEVKDQVREDWLAQEHRHEQEQVAAKLIAEVKKGQSLDDAATVAGVRVTRSKPVARQGETEGVPSQLVQPLFTLKKGEATMVETPEGFVVAQLAEIQDPDPAKDPLGYGQTRDALARSMAQDLQLTLVQALVARDRPTINHKLVDSFAQP